MSIESKIEEIITPSLTAEKLAVVKVIFNSKSAKKALLQIMLERLDNQSLAIAECEKASKIVGALLDVEDIIKVPYYLEIGSAGLDRPLSKPADYKRFLGSKAKIETKVVIDDTKTFKGIIEQVSENSVTLRNGSETLEIDFIDIRNAKLTVSDDLIKEKLKQNKQERKK